jgi:hypothetical protein
MWRPIGHRANALSRSRAQHVGLRGDRDGCGVFTTPTYENFASLKFSFDVRLHMLDDCWMSLWIIRDLQTFSHLDAGSPLPELLVVIATSGRRNNPAGFRFFSSRREIAR